MYARKNGDRDEVFLETAEERQHFADIRQKIRHHEGAPRRAQMDIKKFFDKEYGDLLASNIRVGNAQREHDAKGWWYRFANPRPYGFIVSKTYLIGWRWCWIDSHPDIGVPPALMSLGEFKALELFETSGQIDHLIQIVHVEEDRRAQGYHDFGGFFRDFRAANGKEFDAWLTYTIPQCQIGYKYTIYDNNLPDRGRDNGRDDPDPRADY